MTRVEFNSRGTLRSSAKSSSSGRSQIRRLEYCTSVNRTSRVPRPKSTLDSSNVPRSNVAFSGLGFYSRAELFTSRSAPQSTLISQVSLNYSPRTHFHNQNATILLLITHHAPGPTIKVSSASSAVLRLLTFFFVLSTGLSLFYSLATAFDHRARSPRAVARLLTLCVYFTRVLFTGARNPRVSRGNEILRDFADIAEPRPTLSLLHCGNVIKRIERTVELDALAVDYSLACTLVLHLTRARVSL